MNRQQEAELLSRLRGHAEQIAAAFGLTYRGIVAEHPRVKSRYGACYSDGLISIRLKHATTGEPLKYSSLIDTLCHELAHLRHFNHGPQFKSFFLRLLAWARREGIYCPGPRGTGPSTDAFVPSAEALAIALRPPSRNGVPIFPDPPAAGDQTQLPWERRSTASAPSTKRPSARPRVGPAPVPAPIKTNRAGHEQLTLF